MKKCLLVVFITLILFAPFHNKAYAIENIKASDIATKTDVKIATSKLGLSAWFIEEHRLPIVSLRIAVKQAGSSYDPAGKEGLANIVTNMLMEGAGNYNSRTYKQELEKKAIKLSYNVDNDYLYIEIKTLRENLDRALELATLPLTKIKFDNNDFNRIIKQSQVMLTKSEEDPEYVGSIALDNMIFGKHPYAKPTQGTTTSLKNIKSSDVYDYIHNRIARDQLVIGLAGDINSSTVTSLLDKYFTNLPASRSKNDKSSVTDVTSLNYKTQSITKNIPQTILLFSTQGIKRSDPDFYTAYVLNYILGGGSFESVLMKELREKKGLVYSAYTYLENYQHAALLRGGAATETKNQEQALSIIRNIFETLPKNLSESDVANAKKYLMGSFPLQLDTNDKLALFLTIMQLDNLGKNFLSERNKFIAKVSLPDVKRVAERLLDNSKLSIVIVGNKGK